MYLLVKDNVIVANEGSLEILKGVLIGKEDIKIKTTPDGNSWKIYAKGKELPQGYSADSKVGYTLEEIWQDITAEKLARWLNYSIYQKL